MWSLGMILHKLLFFRLPYHYATDGGADEELASGVRDTEKLERLEREVLNYMGFVCSCPLSRDYFNRCILRNCFTRFKSEQPLVAAFEARRLPRAFLVLLESLLNIMPSSRPSCDRVSSAIREGRVCLNPFHPFDYMANVDPIHSFQLDPLQEDAIRFQTKSSLVPRTRRSSNNDSFAVSSSQLQPEVEPPPGVSEQEPDGSTEDTGQAELSIPPHMEKTPLLEFLSPKEDKRKWTPREFVGGPRTRSFWMMVLKSSILVAKVSRIFLRPSPVTCIDLQN
jgi:hypothetical protein